jgi:micrococcal nuclease
MALSILAGLCCSCESNSGPGPIIRVDAGVVRDGGAGDSGLPADVILAAAVLDGDTLRLSASGNLSAPDGLRLTGTSVRLLGVDAPEIAHAPEPADCWGDEAHARARELVQGRPVTLDFDLAAEAGCTPPIAAADAVRCNVRDDFGRLLAYVRMPDGAVLNEQLIREGHALSFRRYAHRMRDYYNQLEEQARNEGLGVWTCP